MGRLKSGKWIQEAIIPDFSSGESSKKKRSLEKLRRRGQISFGKRDEDKRLESFIPK